MPQKVLVGFCKEKLIGAVCWPRFSEIDSLGSPWRVAGGAMRFFGAWASG